MFRLRRRGKTVSVIDKGDALSFIKDMEQLAREPGSNIKGVKITRNGKDQIIDLKVVASDNELRRLRKLLPRERLLQINRRL